jgi:hypothetical protein
MLLHRQIKGMLKRGLGHGTPATINCA